MGFVGWTCSTCTYDNIDPSSGRCCMCNELRVTRKQMCDFVRGVPVGGAGGQGGATNSNNNKNNKSNNNNNGPQKTTDNRKNLHQMTLFSSRTALATTNANNPKSAATTATTTTKLATVNNPYASALTRNKNAIASSLEATTTATSTATNSVEAAAKHPTTNDNNASTTTIQNPQQQQQPLPPFHPPTSAAALPQRQQNNRPTSNNNNNKSRKRPFPPPFQPSTRCPPPPPPAAAAAVAAHYRAGHVPYDATTTHNWIYPVHDDYPIRQYQAEITQTAVFHNTLVSLPTGLGKTLIASVVMYNYHRWFPTGKVLFLAPTVPLVKQQLKACHGIMGIPESETAVLDGKVPAPQRAQIWNQRQVFFCTPQTVQNDLEHNRCPATMVVCCVFDEAHKASGEYAYCKVVQYLTEANAKVRFVGLSATPGVDIKAIQKVVDALHINRIEARTESDPSVKQYTNERHTETVVVPQSNLAKTVESALTEIISPLLNVLRRDGALSLQSGGNATITSYSLLKASEAFKSRQHQQQGNTGGHVFGYFHAARTFVQMRDDLHSHGIGGVREKLIKLRLEPQKGKLSSVVNSPDFYKLWDLVKGGTGGCTQQATDTVRHESFANNPKLVKLKDILKEHFERKRAVAAAATDENNNTNNNTNTTPSSTRAIVFSQYRGSVSEIVEVLNTCHPLIRPRHFIGQGKGGGGGLKKAKKSGVTDDNRGSTGVEQQPLQGMKQTEQQDVLGKFRDGFYNCLVATCIGEEGLDIGEVDLIVNFDCLSNPIRMLQRIGRTGRKREGRVVCLISEGSEERKFRKSKDKERTLQKALKTTNAFKLQPTVPLLPPNHPLPVRCDQQMKVSNLHMSQIEGHKKKKPPSNSTSSSSQKRQWRLSDAEDAERREVLGRFSTLRLHQSCGTALRRRLLVARNLKQQQKQQSKEAANGIDVKKTHSFGRTTQLLQRFETTLESMYPTPSTTATTAKRTRNSRAEDSSLNILFPLAPTTNSFSDTLSLINKKEEKKKKKKKEANNNNNSSRSGLIQLQAMEDPTTLPQQEARSNNMVCGQRTTNVSSGSAEVHGQSSSGVSAINPYARRPGSSNLQKLAMTRDDETTTACVSGSAGQRQMKQDTSSMAICGIGPKDKQPSAMMPNTTEGMKMLHARHQEAANCRGFTSGSAGAAGPNSADRSAVNDPNDIDLHISRGEVALPDAINGNDIEGYSCLPASDDFILPTPPDSSSSSEDEDEGNDDDGLEAVKKDGVIADIHKAKNPLVQEEHEKIDAQEAAVNDDFSLPTQDSSSSEDESDPEHGDDGLDLQGENPSIPLKQRMKESDEDGAAGPDAADNVKQKLLPTGCLTAGVAAQGSEGIGNDSSCLLGQESEPSERNLPKRRALVVVDTPISRHDDVLVKPHARRRIEETPASCEVSQTRTDSARFSMEVPTGLSAAESVPVESCNTQQSEPQKSWAASKQTVQATDSALDFLADTQASEMKSAGRSSIEGNVDDVVCAVCGSGESIDDDPIILCDGPGGAVECNVCVHLSCYNGSIVLPKPDEEWRCEPCSVRYEGRASSCIIKCEACGRCDGALKKVGDSQWKHVKCHSPNVGTRRLKRLRKNYDKVVRMEAEAKRHRSEGETNVNHQLEGKRRTSPSTKYQRFIDYEAGVDSEDSMDEEEDDIAAIEEEEGLESGFINDSSQLGYSQDELDRVESEIGLRHPGQHPLLDNARERMNEFATPALNSRVRRRKLGDTLPDTPASAPSSEKGLGNMHFIRSVLEHQRQGGNAEDIEKLYHQLKKGEEDDDSAAEN